MRYFLVTSLIILISVTCFCQSDCQYKIFKDPKTGRSFQTLTATMKIGKFLFAKASDTVVLWYATKGVFGLAASSSRIRVALDSARFVFEDGTILGARVNGTCDIENEVKLQPQIQLTDFVFVPDKQILNAFRNKKLTNVAIYGQKGAFGGDVVNEKQARNIMQAANCIVDAK